MEIEADHVSYIDSPLLNEADLNRLWFIANQCPFNDPTFHEVQRLSEYFYNKQAHGCTYSAPKEKQIKECTDRLFR